MVRKQFRSVFILFVIACFMGSGGFINEAFAFKNIKNLKNKLVKHAIENSRKKIAGLMQKDPDQALKESEKLVKMLMGKEAQSAYSEDELKKLQEDVYRNEVFNSASNAGLYDKAGNAIRSAAGINRKSTDSKLILDTNKKSQLQKKFYKEEREWIKNWTKLNKTAVELAKQKEKMVKSFSRKRNPSKADLDNFKKSLASIDEKIANQNKIILKERSNLIQIQISLRGAKVSYTKGQSKIISNEYKRSVALKVTADKISNAATKVVKRAIGNYYYSAQVKAYSKIESIYKEMYKLAKEKLNLIKAAHKNKNLTKKDLDDLKAKLKAISKKILGFRKDLSAQYRELSSLASACKKEGGELSALQKIMLAMRKKRQPKYKKPYSEAVRSGIKALGELVKKFEVSWNGLEPAMKELSALQDGILKKREELLKFAEKSPLTEADKKIIKELKKELGRLLRKEMSLFKKVEDTFLSSENYNKLTAEQKEKFSAMFDSIWTKNDKIHNSKPSFEELFNKLLSAEVKEEDKDKDDNKEASDIFNASVTSKQVSYSEKMGEIQITITDYYDKAGKFLGSKIQIGDKVIWKDANGKVIKEYNESDKQTNEPVEDKSATEALGEPPTEPINIGEPTNTGTIIDQGDYKPITEEPQELMDTL